ncbi:MerR family transcriptional regulator [Streptomyces sp. ET3-23]|uniref:MerR family transcriptional regulator n=1 Tax=Streptomyces sp. ET3-23 TaxID=2885643 RepID=UPI001D0F9807|nr:MerR family transcriptional regulator [Streptomyces sp. ET3-23]MCC2276697.1 MerR family transcriptional regulator [Streptomyces sp. ET3-23]
MLIGELAERTGTSDRLLRHYERGGLLTPDRLPNGYRWYSEPHVETVRRIRALLAAGLPVRTIRALLPCTAAAGEAAVHPCPGVLDTLRTRLADLDARAAELDEARAVLRATIAGAQRAAAPEREPYAA